MPELLSSSSMIACGEDLGMIPASVPEVMEQLCMLSLELERMPKTFGVEFLHKKAISLQLNCDIALMNMSVTILLLFNQTNTYIQHIFFAMKNKA